ncbi:EAL domain-containing protein [Ferrigenium sp. UT5]|uniref:EAL domain-containing protein n=1 Tax=Ferrigenium sp. UT5 TaxID=3242105 RepID=UPI0038B2F4E9
MTHLSQPARRVVLVFCGIAALVQPLTSAYPAEPAASRQTLRVALDDNYPPYIMREADGSPEGYLVDAWQLWEKKTGVHVELIVSDWETAQKNMAEGRADVIDTIFRTPQREQTLDFGPAYASLPVAIFTHANLTGIEDIDGARDFLVGVKAGDACVDRLRAEKILHLQTFPSYETIIRAAIARQINLFCMDEPPANYLIMRERMDDKFRKAFTLYTGEFHRAVHKGDVATQDLVERGFTQFTGTERQALENKWMGQSLNNPLHRNLLYGLTIAAIAIFFLLGITLLMRQLVRQRTAALKATRDQLQVTLDALPDLFFEMDLYGRFLAYHSPRTDLLATPASVFLGKRLAEVMPPDVAETGMSALHEANDAGYSHGRQYALELADSKHWFELSVSRKPFQAGEVPRFIVLSHDITARKLAELNVQKLSKLYAALSQCNQAIVRCADEKELFPVICRDAVNFGGMTMAWIGLLDPVSKKVQPVAAFGAGIEYLEGIELSSDDSVPGGRGPTGTSLREDRPFWCQDFQHDPVTAAWHERGARYGWAASASLPLHRKGEVAGALTLYADQCNAFDEAARNLLLEMAMDISYALDRFADEAERAQIKRDLAESEERYRAAFDQAAVGIARVAPDGKWLEVNQKIADIVGYSREELLQQTFQDITHPDDLDLDLAYVRQMLAGSLQNYSMEKRYLRKSGEVVWVNLTVSLVRDSDGTPKYFVSVVEDISAKKQTETLLRKLSLAVEQSPNTIVITDLEANIEYVNRMFTEVTGYAPEEVIGQNPRVLHSGKTPQATYDDMWAHLTAGRAWRGELINKRKDGTEYIEAAMIAPVHQADGKVLNYLAIKENITEKKAAEARIQQLAHFDQLTGLPNRGQLNERFSYALSLAQRSGESMAVMFLDLDHFKNINDTLGHSIGDLFLVEIAKRLKSCVREEDTVSRLGGDEFILVFPGTDADGAAIVANKLIEAISQPCVIDNHELNGTPSIGIALYPSDGESFEELLKKADTAMYRVKHGSRNDFCFFTTEMQAHSERNLQLVSALHHALARNELQVYYQPQVAMSDGHILGAEALLRWQHPELGQISPAEFIPIAEDSGQIIAIGEWVLRTAVQQAKTWQERGLPPLVIAVNLSAIQFRQPELPDRITAILDEAGLPHEYLELELTEAVAMDDPQGAVEMMDQLYARDIRMSIDDFGTGYSSLSYLKRFKVYKLKIDQSFVRDITSDTDDKAIVTAIINLGSSLGMQTIAEGVESSGQLAFLRLQGCDEVQGYYFSKPLPAGPFEDFVRKQS